MEDQPQGASACTSVLRLPLHGPSSREPPTLPSPYPLGKPDGTAISQACLPPKPWALPTGLPASAGANERRSSWRRCAVSRKVLGAGVCRDLGAHLWLSPTGILVCRRNRARSRSTRCCCPARSSRKPKAGEGRPKRDSFWWTSAVKPYSR